jgi:hypothetical protein
MCREIILPVTDDFFLPFIDYLFPYTKLDLIYPSWRSNSAVKSGIVVNWM